MISYYLNWMGPISIQWYSDRGLTIKEEINSETFGTHIVDKITEHYSGGRIDVSGTTNPYGEEISVPVMRSEDWHRFKEWLWVFKTETMWTLDQLVNEYEKTNEKIVWANEKFKEVLYFN